MSERTLVPIFVLWALLTIITPTLILLSENSKADLDLHGDQGMKARRMMQPPLTVLAAEELAPAPAPQSLQTRRANLTGSHSYHNQSNSTDDEVTLQQPKKHVKQTNTSSTST